MSSRSGRIWETERIRRGRDVILAASALATAVASPASAQSDILLRLRSGSPLGDRFRVDSAGGTVAMGSLGIGIILVGSYILTVCSKPNSVLTDFADNKDITPATHDWHVELRPEEEGPGVLAPETRIASGPPAGSRCASSQSC